MRDWLAHRTASTPDAEALVAAGSGRTWSYEELDEAAEAMAGSLAALGLEAGDHLAVVLDTRVEYVTLVHAAMRLGVRLVPVSDRLTAAELGPRLDRADPTAVLVGAETERQAVAVTTGTGDPVGNDDAHDDSEVSADADGGADATGAADDTVDDESENHPDADDPDESPETDGGTEEAVEIDEAEADGDDGPIVEVPVFSLDEPANERVAHLKSVEPVAVDRYDWHSADPLVYLFTSGSTGRPKLVTLSAGNVRRSAVALGFRLGIDPGDRYLLTLSPHHTGGLMPLYRAVLAGTSVVLRTEFDPGGAADDIRQYDVTGVSLVPTMLKRMLDARGTLSDSLRVVLLGGAPAPEELLERCRDYSVPVHPTYGMTEAASGITVATPSEAFDNLGTVGRPLVWTEVTVRDEDGTALPAGEVGELVVDGPTITPGYYGDEAATDDALGEHGLRTGDVGYRDEDGYLYVLNRKDDRILTGGENVDPGEVVTTLRDHPSVVDAAVVGVPDDEWGERVAALVVRGDESTTAANVEEFCRERLAGFKIPRTIRFADDLPRTDSGTVERPVVRERLAAAAESAIGDAETSDVEPADESASGAEAGEADATGPETADERTRESEPGDTESESASAVNDAESSGDEPHGGTGAGSEAIGETGDTEAGGDDEAADEPTAAGGGERAESPPADDGTRPESESSDDPAELVEAATESGADDPADLGFDDDAVGADDGAGSTGSDATGTDGADGPDGAAGADTAAGVDGETTAGDTGGTEQRHETDDTGDGEPDA